MEKRQMQNEFQEEKMLDDELGVHRDRARRILEHAQQGAQRLQAINRSKRGSRGRGEGRGRANGCGDWRESGWAEEKRIR